MSNPLFPQIEYLETVDSTNAYLKRRILSGFTNCGEPFSCAAKEQTEGRGRNGRKWLNTDGALMLSVAVCLEDHAWQAPLASLAAACAAKDTIDSSGCESVIKWPNDIVCIHESGYSKLCGILCELVQSPCGSWFAILGIGINANAVAVPENLLQPATSLRLETGRSFDLDEMSVLLYKAVCSRMDMLKNDKYALLAHYRKNCFTLGKNVRAIEKDGKDICGIAEAVDDFGRLIIKPENGETVTVTAADVSLRLI